MRHDEYLVTQTLRQGEFRGLRKFVEVRVGNQVVADKLARVVKVVGGQYQWKLRRNPPQLTQSVLEKRFPPNNTPFP